MEEIIYTTILSFLIVIPLMAFIFAVVPIVFFTKGKKILRVQFQNKLLIYIILSVSMHVTAKVMGTMLEYSEITRLILNSLTQTVPAIFYAVCVYLASKRLNGMGYNRFWSLLCVLPVLGPPMLFWLAVSIREKQA